jgi:hypothetical protein
VSPPAEAVGRRPRTSPAAADSDRPQCRR